MLCYFAARSRNARTVLSCDRGETADLSPPDSTVELLTGFAVLVDLHVISPDRFRFMLRTTLDKRQNRKTLRWCLLYGTSAVVGRCNAFNHQ